MSMKKYLLIFASFILIVALVYLSIRYSNDHPQSNAFSNQNSAIKQDEVQYLEDSRTKEIVEVYFNEQDMKLKYMGSDAVVLDIGISSDEQINFYKFSPDKNYFVISTQNNVGDKTVLRSVNIKEEKVETLTEETLDSCPEQKITLQGDGDSKIIVGADNKTIKSIKTDLNRINCINDYYYLWKNDEFSDSSIQSCSNSSCNRIELPGNLINFWSDSIGAIVIFDDKISQYSLLSINKNKISRVVNNVIPTAFVNGNEIWGVSKSCSLYRTTNGKVEVKNTNSQICNAVRMFGFNDSILVYDGTNYITTKK